MTALQGDPFSIFDTPPEQTSVLVMIPESTPVPQAIETEKPDDTPAQAPRSRSRQVLYFDLETIPDESRKHLFDLPPIPEPAVYLEESESPAPTELIRGTLDDVKAAIAAATSKGKKLPRTIVAGTIAAEKSAAKPRKGVVDLFAALLEEIDNEAVNIQSAIAANNKAMSVCPEMCSIVSMAWAIGNGPVSSMVVGMPVEGGPPGETINEADILRKFWFLSNQGKVCGFNVCNFDLPVIFVRSVILGIDPLRKFDLKPWGNDVIDLMAIRYPKSGAKGLGWLAKVNGIESECPDVDGSQVFDLFEAGKLEEIGAYNRDDVKICRTYHKRYSGLFW